jgi:hypothetical protein
MAANRTPFGPLTVEGIVSPCHEAWGNRSIPHGHYTIQALNQILAYVDGNTTRGERFWNFAGSPGLPAALSKELKLMRMTNTNRSAPPVRRSVSVGYDATRPIKGDRSPAVSRAGKGTWATRVTGHRRHGRSANLPHLGLRPLLP